MNSRSLAQASSSILTFSAWRDALKSVIIASLTAKPRATCFLPSDAALMRVSPSAVNRSAKFANAERALSARPNRLGLKPCTGPAKNLSGSMPPPPYTLRPASVYLSCAAPCSRWPVWSLSV